LGLQRYECFVKMQNFCLNILKKSDSQT